MTFLEISFPRYLFLSIVIIHVQCKSVNRIECVLLKECPLFVELTAKPMTTINADVLRTAHCGFDGFEPKVWCPIVSQEQSKNQALIQSRDADVTNARSRNVSKVLLVEDSECGRFEANKITGGDVTALDEYPWTALIYSNRSGHLKPRCGGVIINRQYVVTAAHCTRGNLEYVVLGEYDLRNETDCVWYDLETKECAPQPQMIQIDKVINHPDYSGIHNDIALIRLAKKMDYNDFVSPICLPRKDSEELRDGIKVIVAGWGRTEVGPSPVKRQVTIPIVSRGYCTIKQGVDITSKMICAGGTKNKDACSGDSGGPMNYYNSDSLRFELMGVVSFSMYGCGVNGIPGVYTWLPPYIDWIKQTIY